VPTRSETIRVIALSVLLALSGCSGEPSEREVKNARVFEALLTAVSIKNPNELEADARAIEARHEAGELSEANYRELAEVIARARAKDWAGAEQRAYEFRAKFGDSGAYFD
jgi:hypothetical protein